MFEPSADQADGLRRLLALREALAREPSAGPPSVRPLRPGRFSTRELSTRELSTRELPPRQLSPGAPSLIPMGCCAAPGPCRDHAATVIDRLDQGGFTPLLFDRLDLAHALGGVEAHAPVDRLVLLEEPMRLAKWLGGRAPVMLLLLSHRPDALSAHYATIKSIVLAQGVRRFATCFVDAPTARHGTQAHHRLASCAHRFLDIEIEPLEPVARHDVRTGDWPLAFLQRFEIGMQGGSPSERPVPPGRNHSSH